MRQFDINSEHALRLNAEFMVQTIYNYGMKKLYAYATMVYTMAELGYMPKNEFVAAMQSVTGSSKPTIYRWIKFYKKLGVLSESDGVLSIQGKRAYCRTIGIKSRVSIGFNGAEIASFRKFSKNCIIQIGLLLQNRFKYCLSKIVRNAESGSSLMERIRFPVPRDPNKVGCSISYLANYLNLGKTTVQRALVGSTRKNLVFIRQLPYTELNYLKQLIKSQDIESLGYRYRILRVYGKINLYYTISSTILSPARIRRH